jgi:NitT/TauT family transport system substrate-binding protein
VYRTVLGLCILGVLVACGPSAPPPPAEPAAVRAAQSAGAADHSADNPYLPREGEAPVPVKVATCVVSGSYVHLYNALESNLFAKYGLAVEHAFIGGTAASLAALASNDVQFLYCGVDGTLPGMAVGKQGKIVATTLLGLPYVLITRAEVRSVLDLKGRSVGVARVGDLPDRLLRILLERHALVPNEDVMIRPIGGSTPERHRAMLSDVIQGHLATAPFDVMALKEGHNVVYRLSDLGLPSVGASVHANNAVLRDNPLLVQRFVAAMAESVQRTEQDPAAARQALRRTLDLADVDALDAVYDEVNRRSNRSLAIPMDQLGSLIGDARAEGTPVEIGGPADIATNAYVEELQRTRFLDQLWAGKPRAQ